MKTILLVIIVHCMAFSLAAQTTYYWVGGASANFDQSTSWNTTLGGGGSSRTSPATNDVLVFDGSNYGSPSVSSATVYNLPAQTLGMLQLKNHVTVIFASAATANASPVSGLAAKSGHTITGNGSTNFPTDFAVGDFVCNSQFGAQLSLITAVSGNILTTAETGSYGNSAHYKAATLRISQVNGFTVETGSSLSVTLNNAPFAITLLSGASALIQGTINLQPTSTQGCRLAAMDATGIIVDSAGTVTNGPNNRGNIFSTNAVSTNNNIVFKKGSTYWHTPYNANPSENQVPFGSTVTAPQSVIDLQPGSKLIYSTPNGASFAGFKYGDVQIAANITTTGSPAYMGSLFINSGVTFINNSLTPFPVSGDIINNGSINTSVASTLLLCGTSHQTVGGSGNYFLNGLVAASGSNVSLSNNIQMLSTSTFDSVHAIVVNSAQVLSAAPNANVGVTTNNFLEGSGTPRATPFSAAISKMNMKTLRFQEGEFGDWYLWSKPPYTTPNPHASMWGGSLFPFNQSNIFIIGDTTGALVSNQLGLDQFLTLCKDSAITPYFIIPIDAMMYPDGVTGYVSKQEQLNSAVALVNYVKQKGLPQVYYEIGNENYYPISGTASNQTWTATAYANEVVELSNLMKAADSTIKIGMNGHNYPNLHWYDTIMSIAVKKVDFIIAHNYLRDLSLYNTAKNSWYSTYLYLLNNSIDIIPNVTEATAAINSLTDTTDKARLRIAVTEGSSYSPGLVDSISPQTNTMGKAIIAFDMFASIFSNPRVSNIHFWTTHWFLTTSQTYNQPYNIRNLLGGDNQVTPIGQALEMLNAGILASKIGVTDGNAGNKKYLVHAWYDAATNKTNILVLNRDSLAQNIPVRFTNTAMTGKTTTIAQQLSGVNPDDYTPVFGNITNVSTDAAAHMNITVPAYSITLYKF